MSAAAALSIRSIPGQCCALPTGETLDAETTEALARRFKVLGDPTRVRLLALIAGAAEGEACICDLTDPVGLSQPTVSHHMKLLVDAGLVTREQRGKWAFYRLIPDELAALGNAVTRLGQTG
ncbi:MAG: metalloregulator ArsR/SmtB family transcription factor [Frankiaceae bacterium]|jgi:ArsR family transcriptional regulator|nr:metalloregulator ArsR/SmtB family transcription factor [Frankiaceae bacterium]